MVRIFAITLFSSAILLLGATNAAAADRVQAGQWETTMTLGTAKPMVTKYCITTREARLMSGDLATLRKYLEESTAANTKGRCAVKNVELNGNRTVVTLVCGKTEVVGTTTYHGDRYESSSSDGTTVAGKRLGNCP
ncbi:MAG TPA: DUF3617 family protein [Thermoanaerobaculia bacterium]|jgi:hypothetical protein|nr:DUF3617 family protein [Thermoanaerobaculia bacterium]